MRIQKVCEYCGDQYIAKTTLTRYCSHQCNSRHYKQLKRNERLQQAQKEDKYEVPAKHKEVETREFLSIKQASVLIGVSERTLFRLLKNKTLKATKLGGRTIISRKAIDNLFKIN